MTYQNVWDVAQAVFRGEVSALATANLIKE